MLRVERVWLWTRVIVVQWRALVCTVRIKKARNFVTVERLLASQVRLCSVDIDI
jgi:hypothetical protein